MPTVEFSFPDLLNLLGREYKPEELKDRISMMGVDLEEINNNKVVVEIFPDRPDLLSVEGFARALRGVLNLEIGFPVYKPKESGIKLYVDPSVKGVRPFIAAAVIKGIKLDEERLISMMDIQEKLHITHGRNRKKVAIGVHSLSHIKQPFTFKALSPKAIKFRPLDLHKEMTLSQILREHPKGREYAWILEGMNSYPVIVDKNNEVLSFPPIINAELTRVTHLSKDLFIEITGLDELAVNQALNIIVTSIAERGGEIYSVEINPE